MGGLTQYWEQGDAIGRAVAIMLLLMSISAWVVIFWKGWLLKRARRDLTLGVQAFWQSPDMVSARQTLQGLDREGVLLPLVDAVSEPATAGTLEARALPEAQLTRRLRDSLHGVLARLQVGQVLLASVGAVSPFVGLFGTVWGIYHAMMGIATEGSVSLDKVAGPVGEALIMTAAGLAVAIPAVLAYNIFGKYVSACEADLEGFAHDLREALLGAQARD
ncbi:MotA/TolQ/ExbB proton channel family protein [Aquabacterium sp.]|uniref:MotA/TolQ/ExbB proton channel family protein n=1 Tax=Aquabacterium sp. TaxID=1872578 RepID=UPI0025C10B6E|nr:MotA/TolQ/ExbB proton channel family protein [Aquabacterium sp.]MBI3382355.1 MotA/TolQ/ExbB proton channel family protein [Aquabacterium sp.]